MLIPDITKEKITRQESLLESMEDQIKCKRCYDNIKQSKLVCRRLGLECLKHMYPDECNLLLNSPLDEKLMRLFGKFDGLKNRIDN